MAAGLDAPLTVARLQKRSDTLPKRYGAVAQLVERDNRTVEARGSIPLSSTNNVHPRRINGRCGLCAVVDGVFTMSAGFGRIRSAQK